MLFMMTLDMPASLNRAPALLMALLLPIQMAPANACPGRQHRMAPGSGTLSPTWETCYALQVPDFGLTQPLLCYIWEVNQQVENLFLSLPSG